MEINIDRDKDKERQKKKDGESQRGIERDKNIFNQFLLINQSFICQKIKEETFYIRCPAYGLKLWIPSLRSKKDHCVKNNFVAYLVMTYLSNKQVV